MKKILAIVGSASRNSANQKLVEIIAELSQSHLEVSIFNDLKGLPAFDPERSIEAPPPSITQFRKRIEAADGVIVCTPEYVFSIPSGLKNALEWCVATTIFSNKPIGLITASAHGQKGHEQLQVIMQTLMADFTEETTLLIQGVKGKFDDQGALTDRKTRDEITHFIESFKSLVLKTSMYNA